jgi:hypothetical protein
MEVVEIIMSGLQTQTATINKILMKNIPFGLIESVCAWKLKPHKAPKKPVGCLALNADGHDASSKR